MPALLLLLLASLLEGPGVKARRTRRCSAEEALSGPATVAGHGYGCRTGPSPSETFRKRVREDRELQRCFETAKADWLDATVLVSSEGSIIHFVVDELRPATADVRPCFAHFAARPLIAAGCELEMPLHFARFESEE